MSSQASGSVTREVTNVGAQVSRTVTGVASAVSADTSTVSTAVQTANTAVSAVVARTARQVTTQVERGRGGGQAYLGQPTDVDVTGAVYFYLGWDGTGSDPLRVRRVTRATGAIADATNVGTDFATAWANRASLSYGVI